MPQGPPGDWQVGVLPTFLPTSMSSVAWPGTSSISFQPGKDLSSPPCPLLVGAFFIVTSRMSFAPVSTHSQSVCIRNGVFQRQNGACHSLKLPSDVWPVRDLTGERANLQSPATEVTTELFHCSPSAFLAAVITAASSALHHFSCFLLRP